MGSPNCPNLQPRTHTHAHILLPIVLACFLAPTPWSHNNNEVSALTPAQRLLVDQAVELYMTSNHVPGMGLTIVEQNGGSVFSIGYGKSRLESDTLTTSQTIFSIASVTKSITSIVVVKALVEKYPHLGESVLDVPVAQLVPGFNFTLGDRFRSEFTSFRDLLSHRTCLATPLLSKMLGMVADTDEFNYRSRYQSESCPFRSKFDYSNSMYSLASSLIREVVGGGVTFADLVTDLFGQLGMVDSQLIDTDGTHEGHPRMSHAYYRKDNSSTLHQFNTGHLRRLGIGPASGGGLSTPRDMGQYLKFILNKGRVGNVQVVPEHALAWAYKSVVTPYQLFAAEEPVGRTGVYGYGLGVTLGVYEGNPRIMHGGYWSPYESLFTVFPDQEFGLFCTINGPGSTGRQPGQVSQEQLHHLIFDIVHRNLTRLPDANFLHVQASEGATVKGLRFDNPGVAEGILRKREHKKLSTGKRMGRVEPEDIVGVYGCPDEGEATISLESESGNQRLAINFGFWGLGTLLRIDDSDTTFAVEWISPVDEDNYSDGLGAVPFWLDFGVADEFHLFISYPSSNNEAGFIAFYKDRLIDGLPVIPWEPDSCGPSSL